MRIPGKSLGEGGSSNHGTKAGKVMFVAYGADTVAAFCCWANGEVLTRWQKM